MGILLKSQGKYDEAMPYYVEALETQRRILGDEHPDTLVSINALIKLYDAWTSPSKHSSTGRCWRPSRPRKPKRPNLLRRDRHKMQWHYEGVLPKHLGQFTTHLNNNTPAIAEVLWGGGLWWGLRAKAHAASSCSRSPVVTTPFPSMSSPSHSTQPTRR